MTNHHDDDEAISAEYQAMMASLGPVDPPPGFVRGVVDHRPQGALVAVLTAGGVTIALFVLVAVLNSDGMPWSGLTDPSTLRSSQGAVMVGDSTTDADGATTDGIEPRVRTLVAELTSQVGFAELD